MIYYVLAALACAAWLSQLELKRVLMMFQQNSYRIDRYRRWLASSHDSTSGSRIIGMLILLLSLTTFCPPKPACLLVAIFGVVQAIVLLRAKYKKPLVWTARACRLYGVGTALNVGIWLASYLIFGMEDLSTALIATFVLSHIIICAAGVILSPVEALIRRWYYNDAAKRLRSMPELKIIGITGSYGKTSTKHYLHAILSELFDTLMTPGSFNTTLGVVRTIREYLKPYNEVFIVEMGAKARGDVKEICDLVHPTMGIITAVGPQHLESFKTIENVQKAKFELADALPADGVAIINNDFEHIANREVTNASCARYGVKADADYRAVDVKYTSHGTTFAIVGPDNWRIELSTRLMGECNVSDLLAAAVAAHLMGVPDRKIAQAVAAIEPVEHRLSVKRTPGGITILDDAFNSNPVGSRMALEVLATFTEGQRIVITPGMIELGDQQYQLNRDFGAAIAQNVDIAIIVGHYNRDAITEGIIDAGKLPQEKIFQVESFAKAQELLVTMVKPGDTVLYENDLPDTFK